MSYFGTTTFRKPHKPAPQRKGLNKVAKKGDFWLFVAKVLNLFFLKIEMPRRCQKCDGSAYCGPLQPAHTRRRMDIRVGDWYYALRVVPLGNDCHFDVDKQGRRAAEPILEELRTESLNRLGITEERAQELLLECALEVQTDYAKEGKFQEYVVTL
jgi:hypothetical protein